MAHIIWTELALQDLEEIAEYIALDNHDAASKLVQKVFKKVERLEDHPLSGRKLPEIRDTHYREVIVDPCRIFYRIEADRVLILYVMRGERQLRKYLIQMRHKEHKANS